MLNFHQANKKVENIEKLIAVVKNAGNTHGNYNDASKVANHMVETLEDIEQQIVVAKRNLNWVAPQKA